MASLGIKLHQTTAHESTERMMEVNAPPRFLVLRRHFISHDHKPLAPAALTFSDVSESAEVGQAG